MDKLPTSMNKLHKRNALYYVINVIPVPLYGHGAMYQVWTSKASDSCPDCRFRLYLILEHEDFTPLMEENVDAIALAAPDLDFLYLIASCCRIGTCCRDAKVI